jgi:hypothetical protein
METSKIQISFLSTIELSKNKKIDFKYRPFFALLFFYSSFLAIHNLHMPILIISLAKGYVDL